MITHLNYLFMLNLNSFPLISSFSFFNVILGCFFALKIGFFFLLVSLIGSILSSFLWWISHVEEYSEQGNSDFNLINGVKVFFLLFISSEVFFFFSFFWSYFHFFFIPILSWNFYWPPYSLLMFNFLDVPFLNTIILLSSGVSITLSHYFMILKKSNKFLFFLGFTLILGFTFSFFQLLEYKNSFFSMNDSSFGSCFFLLTGFHGLHVLVGSVFLFFVFFRSFFYYCDFNYLSFELSSWYWHFVDVVWIFLYFFVYIFSS